jgi:tRNA (guanosine-2'-O-)-methyltransferase
VKQLGPTDQKRLHRAWNRRTAGRVAVLLDSVESPFNIGAIVRTAAAFRVDHLYLAGSALSPAHAKAGKTAMGTERYLTWTRFERGAEAADAARHDGFRVVGLELAEGAVPVHQLPAGADVCLAVGHEDHGLSPATLAACDAVAFIPQLGRVGSLNVATATAIAVYELRRSQWVAAGDDDPHAEEDGPAREL